MACSISLLQIICNCILRELTEFHRVDGGFKPAIGMRDGASDDQDPQPLALPAARAVCAGGRGPPSLPSKPIKAPLRSFSSRKFWIIQLEFWLLIEDFGPQCNFVRRAIYKYIPRSRHNPKILGVDDAEIVGDRIT